MKKCYYSLICALVVFSCAKMEEPVDVPENAEEVSAVPANSFSAYLEIPDPITKTSLSDNGDGTYKLLWSNDDRIIVTDGTNTATYSTTSTDVKADFTWLNGTEPTGTFYAYYYGLSGLPSGAYFPVALSGINCKFTINSSYTPLRSLHDQFFNPMYAESASTSLNFKNIFGVLRLSLSGSASDNIGAVTISADQPIAGEVTIVADGTAFKAVVDGDTQQTVRFSNNTYRQLSDGLVLYIPMAPNDYTNFTISVYNQDKSKVCVKRAKAQVPIERSKLSSITLTNIAFSSIFDGAGTEADPFQIKSEGDIQVLSSAIRNTGASFSGKYFKVMNDITLTEPHKPFALNCAQFDGNGKTITLGNGFASGYISYVGLFSSLTGTTSTVTVKDLTVNGTVTLANIYNYGTITASMKNPCTISNCTSNVNVTVDNTAGNTVASVGGIAGYDADANNCRIENSHNTGNISVEGGGFKVGGIAAYVNGSIINSGNSGNINVSGTELHSVGGITGSTISDTNDSVIDGCYNTGDILTYSSSIKTSASTYSYPFSQTSYSGGIVGYSGTSVRNCYNTGSVTATRCAITSGGTTVVALAGGITGYGFNIQNCFNLGDITAQGGNVNNDRFYQPFAGGISAASGTITNSYNAGTMTTKSYSSDGTYLGVTESLYGGIIGLKYTYNSNTYGAAVNCYSLSGKGSIIGCVQSISSTATINKHVFPSESGTNCSLFDSSLQAVSAVNINGSAFAAGSSLLDLLNAGQASLGSGYKTWKTGSGSPAYPVFND